MREVTAKRVIVGMRSLMVRVEDWIVGYWMSVRLVLFEGKNKGAAFNDDGEKRETKRTFGPFYTFMASLSNDTKLSTR